MTPTCTGRKKGACAGCAKTIYWHRELPPLEAEVIAEHTIEASSSHVAGTLSHRDALWDQCYTELMARADHRLRQEIVRLDGDYAHVHDESIEPHRNEASGEAWLQGRFHYVLYRRPQALTVLGARPDQPAH